MKKFITTLLLFQLCCCIANGQSSKFQTETNYKKYIGKAKYSLGSKNCIFINLDDYFTYKNIGVGVERKISNFLISAQISKGRGVMGKSAAGNLSNPLISRTSFIRDAEFKSAIYNTGGLIGAYKLSRFGSTSGVLYGITAMLDRISVDYIASDGLGNNIPVTNSLTRTGAFATIGMRAIIIDHVGLSYIGGVGYRQSTMGTTNNTLDFYNAKSASAVAGFMNLNLFITF